MAEVINAGFERDTSSEKMAANFYVTEENPYSYSRHGKIFLRKINDTYRLNYIELESRRDHVPDTFLSLMLYVFFFIFIGVLGCIIQSCKERRRERTTTNDQLGIPSANSLESNASNSSDPPSYEEALKMPRPSDLVCKMDGV